MTKKNIFAYKLFFSVNISDFIFYVTIATPHEKGHPLFPTTPSKSWGPVKPPFLKIWLKVQPLGGGRGVHTMQTLLSILKHNRTISRFLTATFKQLN